MKVKGPLLSIGAHGSIAKTITYSKRRSGQQARKYNKPLTTPSGAQRGQRRLTEFLVAQWQNMTAGDKATWNAAAEAATGRLAGYHYFLREAQRDPRTHANLRAYWHCNAFVAGQVLDISGNGNHGTPEPTYPSNAPKLVLSEKPRFGNALEYDGVDEYLNCGYGESIEISDNLSLEVLVQKGGSNTRTIYNKGYDADIGMVAWLYIDAGNTLRFRWGDGTTRDLTNANTKILSEYTYITVTFEGGTVKFYRNGLYDGGKISEVVTMKADSGFNTQFGQYWSVGHRFTGKIDEMCLYGRVLSPGEIYTRYHFAQARAG